MSKNKENKKENIEKTEKIEIVEEKVDKKTDYILATFLIFLGVVLLLNTMEIVEWSVWGVLWRFWPLFIIFWGLRLIFDSSKAINVILSLLIVLTLTLILLWSASLVHTPHWFNRVVESESEIQQDYLLSVDEYPDVERKNISIDMAVGSLSIENQNLSDHLFLDSEYSETVGKPILKTENVSNLLDVNLELGKGSGTFFWGRTNAPKYSLILGTDGIPTNLTLNLGAGQGDLLLQRYNLENLTVEVGAGTARTKLKDIMLRTLNAEVGAGKLDLELTGDTQVLEVINVMVGVGKLTLILPEGAEYKLDANIGIGSVKTVNENISGFGQDTVELKTDGYDLSDTKFRIVAEVGIGELVIK